MNNGCCSKCQAKSKKMKKSKKLKEESDEEDVEQKQKLPENENPETDSNEEKESHGTSDQKDKKEKNIVTWRHTSTKKEKGHGKNLSSPNNNGVKPPCYTARSMMYHGGPNPSNRWRISVPPRGCYRPYGGGPFQPFQSGGGGGGPFQPYQSMAPATMYNGAHISPYPPMAAPVFPPNWQTRPFMDTNPMTRYTSYLDNYSFFCN
ncbi:hypothetical protein EUTSA_v10009886mg [Eutrema salsugineum]|uniref:Uncharacterized protein n=1 Tax=Eutrema salsugineum TaxID=72664 RepID=V4KZ24_EUTSA|nr:uncharacterized protein LOC18994528 [Eutrema salsugineum]ESQ36599.1 hypothetical protein EUTSA_v10009886mg [Eutrema salsugineum]